MTKTKSNITEKVSSFLLGEEALARKYAQIQKLAKGIYSTGYDLSNKCNLKCEGCLYFDGDGWADHIDNKTLLEWDEFFRLEVGRGVNYPFIAGAEASLQMDRLRLANKYWKHGIVFTNGIVPIDKDISFSIHVSLWGEKTSKILRGADVTQKALDNYRNDNRATFIYTLTHKNIHQISEIAQLVIANNGKLSFNHFSPTLNYAKNLAESAIHNDKHFRFSSQEDNLCLTDNDLETAKLTIDELIQQYPESIICSQFYNEAISSPNGIYAIEAETGFAKDCATRHEFHKYYRIDHKEDQSSKNCCVPYLDCRSCRGYAFSYPSLISRMRRHLKTKTGFIQWLETYHTWCKMAFVDWELYADSDVSHDEFWQPHQKTGSIC